MTNTKSTKRALLVSVMAMVICFTMLLGTTFAWFTDEVVSENNVIKSGNLDVTFKFSQTGNGTDWTDVADADTIFDEDALWEPGYTDVVYLEVHNAGSLALNFRFVMNTTDHTGKTKTGAVITLSNFINCKIIKLGGTCTPYATREAAMTAAAGATTIQSTTLTGDLEAGDTIYYAIVAYMPTSVNNDANHDGTNIPSIDIGLNVYASQKVSEDDGFNSNDYDEGRPNP